VVFFQGSPDAKAKDLGRHQLTFYLPSTFAITPPKHTQTRGYPPQPWAPLAPHGSGYRQGAAHERSRAQSPLYRSRPSITHGLPLTAPSPLGAGRRTGQLISWHRAGHPQPHQHLRVAPQSSEALPSPQPCPLRFISLFFIKPADLIHL